MNLEQFKQLHRVGRISITCEQFPNNLKSDTDPTQDVPVRNIQFMANGDPINVLKRNLVFNGLSPDKLTTIEKRNFDNFDVLGEQQDLEKKVATNIHNYKQLKKQKENEN